MAATLTDVAQWIAGGFQEAQFANSTSGIPYTSSLSAGNIAGTTVLKGAKSANIEIPEAEILQIPGDDTVRGVIQFPGNALPTFDLIFSDLTRSFVDTLQGTIAVDVQSVYEWLILDPANRTFPDIFLILTRQAYSTEAGSTGNGYESILFPQCTISFSGPSGHQTGANEAEYKFKVTVNRTTQLPWGTPLSTGTHGTTAASGFMFWSEAVPTFDVAKKNGSTTDWTLTKTYASNAQAVVWKNVSGTASTDTGSVDSGNNQWDGAAAGSSGDLLIVFYEKVTG